MTSEFYFTGSSWFSEKRPRKNPFKAQCPPPTSRNPNPVSEQSLRRSLSDWVFGNCWILIIHIKIDYLKEFDDILDVVENRTGLTFYYNYLLSQQPEDFSYYPKFLEKPEVRRAIHVGNLSYEDISLVVHEHLFDDMSKTIRPWLETLLESEYKVST